MRPLAIAAAAGLVLGVAGCAPMAPRPMDLPEPVRAPAGHRAMMTWTGTGDLTYECRARADNPGAFEWAFVAPAAELTDAGTRAKRGKYYGGPTWEANDGSKGTGKQVAVAPSPPGNIPMQLVKTDPSSGAFAKVTYIQRVNTKGGVAPSAACNASMGGKRQTVPYSADYVFYGAG